MTSVSHVPTWFPDRPGVNQPEYLAGRVRVELNLPEADHRLRVKQYGGPMSFTLMESSSLPAEQSRRAKIVATLGPSCSTEAVFRELLRAGLDVARLNFSHGTHPEKLKLIEMVRKVSQ